MKKNILLLFVFLSAASVMSAQDTIRFTDGTKQNARVEEVTSSMIKYKRADNLEGPVFSVPVNKISSITYLNGSRDVFTQNRPAQPEVKMETNPQAAQVSPVSTPTVAKTGAVKFMGPRIGCTYITEGTVAREIEEKGKVPFVSQFGWQFETRIFSSVANMSGLIEFVPLVAGLEQGMFLPSANLLFGLRGKEGLEFAVGPNLSLSGFGMVFAVGTSFHFEDVYFPVNIAFVPSVSNGTTTVSYTGKRTTVVERTGHRITFLIGFNTRKRY